VVIFGAPARSRDTAHAQCETAVYTGKMHAWFDVGVIGRLQPNISVTGSTNRPPTWNRIPRKEWSRDRWRHV